MGTLFVVSTPIGNLEDITLRALRVLREVSLIAAEDTRHTRKLLARYEISTPTVSYHQHSAASRTRDLLAALATGDVALVTDAGTPSLSDPGGELVEVTTAAGFPVVAVPGPSALLTLIASAGLPATRFAFLGFLARKGRERTELLHKAVTTGWPFVVYESAARLPATLGDLLAAAGDRPVAIGRELTKLHEEVYRGTLSAAIDHFGSRAARGEVTILVGGALPVQNGDATASSARLDDLLRELREQGRSSKEAARQAAAAIGISTREAYERLVEIEATWKRS